MPISIGEIADRDEVVEKTVTVTRPRGGAIRVRVSYYPNRLNTADDEGGEAVNDDGESGEVAIDPTKRAPPWDESFCDFMRDWDVAGPVVVDKGPSKGKVLVAKDEPVPLDPFVTQYVPLWFKQGIQTAVIEAMFPNRSGSRESRRR